jgi:hypothetical protein
MLQDMALELARFFSQSLNFTNVAAGSVSITGVSAVERRRAAAAASAASSFAFTYAVRAAALPQGGSGPSAALQAALAGSLSALAAALASVRSIAQELGGAEGDIDLQSSSVQGLLAPPVPVPCSGPGCPLKGYEVALLAVFFSLSVLALAALLRRAPLFKAALAPPEVAPALALRSAGATQEPSPQPDELLHASLHASRPSDGGGAEFAVRVEFITHLGGGRGKASSYLILKRFSDFTAADEAARARFGDAALPVKLPPPSMLLAKDAGSELLVRQEVGLWLEGLVVLLKGAGGPQGAPEGAAFLEWERRDGASGAYCDV